ncbi:hypothetical protein ColKHC_14283 [Colletotrichum higginsianum]|nr:hypothetical protein ColKHC_14283 [Colletotrichum higginsianum]
MDNAATPPTPPSVHDLSNLPRPLKDLVNAAVNAGDDDALLDIWVHLCRATAFLGPSAQRFDFPVAHTLATAARAAEAVVCISDFPHELQDTAKKPQ